MPIAEEKPTCHYKPIFASDKMHKQMKQISDIMQGLNTKHIKEEIQFEVLQAASTFITDPSYTNYKKMVNQREVYRHHQGLISETGRIVRKILNAADQAHPEYARDLELEDASEFEDDIDIGRKTIR